MSFDINYLGHNFIVVEKFSLAISYKCSICNMRGGWRREDDYSWFWDYKTMSSKKDNVLSCNDFIIKKLLE